VIDRRFWVVEGEREIFEAAFAIGGPWSKLLYQADGYVLSECCCESPELRQYRVKDFWSWHRNFEVFRARSHAEIERFEEWLRVEALVEKQQFLGAYYEKFDDGSEEDLVLS
jgi:hypothetical protein